MWELLISTILGIASGAATAGINNTIAGKREDEARAANYTYGRMSGEDADRRTRALYHDLYSPMAQYNQLKEIGLSPSYYYSNGAAGISGQSGASNESTGVQPNVYGMDTAMLAQLENMRADTELKKAEANKTEKDAENLEETKKRTIAETAKTWAQVGETEASEALMKAKKYLTRVQTTTSLGKMQYEIAEAAHNAKRAYWEAASSELKWEFDNDSYIDRLNQISEQVKLTIQSRYKESKEIEVMNKQIAYFDEQIEYLKKQGEAAATNAEAYGEYVEAYAKNLPEQIKLRSQELEVEKWKIGVDAFCEFIHTVGYLAGASQLGDGGYMVEENDETRTYNQKGKQTGSQTHTHTAKKTKIPKLPRIR